MRCICEQKTATLIVSRKEVLFDVGNYAFVEGDIMTSGDEHTRHQVFDIVQDGNIERVNRVLDLAYSECVEKMYPFTKLPIVHHIVTDDIVETDDDFVFRLKTPEGFSKTTAEYLTKLLHEYMAYRVLADWLSITKPESWKNWDEKMQGVSASIKSILNHRGQKYRRTQSPF